jgi:DNA-binding NarL/FixJ family response regulator
MPLGSISTSNDGGVARGTPTDARILLVDDHEVVREGLKFLLAASRPQWQVCGEAASAAEAIRLALELAPDIILLDISMPGMSGLEAASEIRKLGLTPPILIFTTHQAERLAAESRRAGAQGLVLKSQAFHDLVAAMEVLLVGGTFFSPSQPQQIAEDEPSPAIRIEPDGNEATD